jgi:hypothetical protein
MRRAARRFAAAALPLVSLGTAAVERIPVPIEAPAEEPKTPEPLVAVPDALRRLGIESWWDTFGFAPWGATLGLSFDGTEQRTKSVGGGTQRFGSQLATEDLTIRNDNFWILDPRFFSSSLSLGFVLEQERQQADQQHLSQSGHLVNYAFDGTFFPDSAYNVNLSALRSESTYVLPSGTTTHGQLETSAVRFMMREDNFLRDREILPYFSANARFAHESNTQETRSGDQSYRQDDRRDYAVLDFHNGGETSDLSVQYLYSKLDNRVYEPGSYNSQTLTLNHSIDFGPTLNRRLDSRINYYERKGRDLTTDINTLEVSEFLTIDHNVERSSWYSYQLLRQDTAYGIVTAQNGTAQLYQQVYANFSLTGGVIGGHTALPGGTFSSLGFSANGNYAHRLWGDGNLTASAGGGYLVSSSYVPAGLVSVVDAPYAVPDATGAGATILLKDTNILASTLVVVVLKGGARVPAVLDVDYSIRVDGDRTSIVPNPASAVMLPGDTLNVTYEYQVDSDAKYATTSRSASVAIDWNWIGASFYHDESDQKPLSGSGTEFLMDTRRENAMVWVSGTWNDVQARADAAAVLYDSTRLAYTERRMDQYVSWAPRRNLQFNFSANEYRTEYRVPEHVTNGGSVRLDVQWTQGMWLNTGYASRRVYRDTLQPHETIDEAGLRLRRTWTKLDLSIALGAQRRERGETSTTNGFIHFNATRRF